MKTFNTATQDDLSLCWLECQKALFCLKWLCSYFSEHLLSVSDSVSNLRKRLNAVERDRLEAASKSNHEVKELQCNRQSECFTFTILSQHAFFNIQSTCICKINKHFVIYSQPAFLNVQSTFISCAACDQPAFLNIQ